MKCKADQTVEYVSLICPILQFKDKKLIRDPAECYKRS